MNGRGRPKGVLRWTDAATGTEGPHSAHPWCSCTAPGPALGREEDGSGCRRLQARDRHHRTARPVRFARPLTQRSVRPLSQQEREEQGG